jgi:4-diphosphocytidyl-2-C-methyl-D-erythritol kinase
LKKEYPSLPEVSMHLHKVIPMGAGLGGGSADGSFALTSLNDYFHLGLDREQLKALSLQLGSDCPFFILNQPCFATGRGELLKPLSLDLSGYDIILVYPGIAVSTAEAFRGISPQKPSHSLPEKITEPVEKWKDWMVNDFEHPVFRRFPEIAKIKEDLYNAGALYAAMTGSGSSCFGIFRNPPEWHFPGSYRVFRVQVK